jgi:hypothetical protein
VHDSSDRVLPRDPAVGALTPRVRTRHTRIR